MTRGWDKVLSGWYSHYSLGGIWEAKDRPVRGGWVLTHPTETWPEGQVFPTLTAAKGYVAGYEAAMEGA